MDGKRNKWLRGALAALPLLGACALPLSCVDKADEVAAYSADGGEAKVVLHVTVGEMGDLNATRGTNTNIDVSRNTDAEPGELIHSLCVFIVNANDHVIEAKIQPTATDFESHGTGDASTGDLEDYTSEEITISSGPINIYAFANWETADDEGWNKLINKHVGGTITEEELQILIDDPAGNVGIAEGNYIPMSGMEENVTLLSGDLNGDAQTVTVELVRLVSKVFAKVKLYDDDDETTDNTVTVHGLKFTGTADQVWLFDEKKDQEKESGIKFDKGFTKGDIGGEGGITVTEGETADVFTFYINESDRSGLSESPNGFAASLKIDEYNGYERDGDGYIDQTNTTIENVKRNYIYAFTLTLDSYIPEFTPASLISILGVNGQVVYETGSFKNTDGEYEVELPDVTSQFTLTAKMKDVKENNYITDDIDTWLWEYQYKDENDEEAEPVSNKGDKTNKLTVSQLTATEYKYKYNLTVDWDEDDGIPHHRKYTINVNLKDNFDPTYYWKESQVQKGEATAPVIIQKNAETFK